MGNCLEIALLLHLLMKRNISIQLKAVFLLIVFGLNMMVGFACAIGVDLGFNATHHHDEEAIDIHEHADGVKHDHQDSSAKHEHDENKPEKKEKKGCCNDDVQKFQSLDKGLNQNAKTFIDAPVFVAIVSTFLGMDVYNLSRTYPQKYKARFFYPPPHDIRIAIQSFQI